MLNRAIGNYRIVGELAKGGMGAVYRAHHRHLPREVVIKSIQLECFSESAQELLKARFRREAFVQSQLDHTNIVRVLEFFETSENYYLVMEYVPGVSLRELLEKQGIPAPKQAVFLFKQILSALEYAHNFSFLDETGHRQKGIIHRDINPANLLLDNNGRVKIADFGTVKLAGTTRLTQIGFHPGTIEYMSPEQLRGGHIDARSDIYSVGVSFYEMLTGQLPFPMSEEGSDWEVRKGHIELPPPPISKLNPNVPPDLATIVMRSLEKSPDDRYQSAAEFLKALKYLRTFAEENKQKVRGYSRKFGKMAPAVKTIIKLDPAVFPQRMDNLFEQGDAVTIPVLPFVPRLSPNAAVTQPAKVSKTDGALLRLLDPFMEKFNLTRQMVLQAAILFGLASILVFLLLRTGALDWQKMMTNMNQAAPSDATGEMAGSSVTLKQAQSFEKQENYDKAILAYETILFQSPKAEQSDRLTMKIMQLRTFQTLIEAGRIAERGERLMAARQHYFEALQIRPDSEIARIRLAEIDQRLSLTLRCHKSQTR